MLDPLAYWFRRTTKTMSRSSIRTPQKRFEHGHFETGELGKPVRQGEKQARMANLSSHPDPHHDRSKCQATGLRKGVSQVHVSASLGEPPGQPVWPTRTSASNLRFLLQMDTWTRHPGVPTCLRSLKGKTLHASYMQRYLYRSSPCSFSFGSGPPQCQIVL